MRAFRDNMGRPFVTFSVCRNQYWFVCASFLIWFLLLCVYHSQFMVGKSLIALLGNHNINISVDVASESDDLIDSVSLPEEINESSSRKSRDDAHMNIVFNDRSGGDFNLRTKDVFGITEHGFEKFGHLSKKESEPRGRNDQARDLSENKAQSEKGDDAVKPEEHVVERVESDSESVSESCLGKYIYVHDIPSKFNKDFLKKCGSLSNWTDMCELASNFGLGPRLSNFEKVYSNTGWFATNQFLLEVIFHSRMKQYNCLTKNSSLASAIFVPYYAGLDVARYLWGSSISMRDSGSLEIAKWLTEKPEWKKMWGRDHFMVAGRITWDFRRWTDKDSEWGTKLMLLPESKNMTMLAIESSPWNSNDFAIPYPTYFHPSKDIEVFQWQNRMRRQKRRILFSFAGGPRPNLQNSIRNEIIDQCKAARRKCKLLECTSGPDKCHKPVFVMKMFQGSVFCMQPPGDSLTRRSIFDSILAGCIPVFFHPGSAYVQYLWHLPKDYTKYSVLIPAFDIKKGKVSIERILNNIPRQKVYDMREEVVKLIPRVIYADPGSRLETLEDAFDIAVKGVLERVETIRKDMREGKNTSFDYAEKVSWKYNLFGTVEEHEWDPFFERQHF
ncbi:probable xyloglucan galactosyltransferase GT11 [Pyrus x bretschneideri]|uniref:probable xyloglucan galactosyltransferase GT11 n=1 Tax=Pyrus x bretschneideri TaxID=225117 RepID=UPI00202EF281|nr:probable xyloglucan galactosyltransferase GT11 [Pyrus x bretschneideri]